MAVIARTISNDSEFSAFGRSKVMKPILLQTEVRICVLIILCRKLYFYQESFLAFHELSEVNGNVGVLYSFDDLRRLIIAVKIHAIQMDFEKIMAIINKKGRSVSVLF